MKKLLVAGALVVSVLAFLMPTASAQGATIMLIHGIPETDVDVEAGGELVIEGFQFGDMQDLSALAGQTLGNLRVLLAGTDTAAIEAGDVALPSAGNFSVIAHLDAAGTPTLSVFENDTASTAAGTGRLIVRHTAQAPEVDVLANGEVAFAAVPNGAEGQADLPAGTVTASVVPAGATEPVVIGPADLPIVDGQALIVYAVGSLDGETIDVLTQSVAGLATTPSAVNTGNSPVSDGGTNGTLIALVIAAALLAVGGLAVARRSNARVRA